jgi:O-antigen/teichoic acid export membrane protein
MNRNIEKAEKIRHAVEFQRKMILILSLVTLPAVMFPQIMLAIMFSTKFAAVGNLVFLFIFAQFITQLAGVHQAILVGVDDLKLYTAIVTGGQLGFALLAWFLAPYYGIKGIALAGMISSLAIFFLTFVRLKLKHGFSIPRNLSLLMAYSLSSVLVTGWVCSRLKEWDVTTAALKTGFFSLFVVSLFFFLTKSERIALYGLRNKFFFRQVDL